MPLAARKPKRIDTPSREEPGRKLGSLFDWRKAGYRVLVAPKRDYSISVHFYKKEQLADGNTISKAHSLPLSMRVIGGGELDLLGYGDLELEPRDDPAADGEMEAHIEGGAGSPARSARMHELPEITAGTTEMQPERMAHLKRIPLYGCQLRIDERLASEFPGLFGGFEDMVEKIMTSRKPFNLYGKRYAFVDDAEGMRRLMPAFSAYVRDRKWDEDDQTEVLRNPVGAQVGPRLWADPKERHRFEPRLDKDGRQIGWW